MCLLRSEDVFWSFSGLDHVDPDADPHFVLTPEPVPYTLAEPRPAPTFGPFRAIVDDILVTDRTAPPKQRHTATQIFRRLVAEHQTCGRLGRPTRRHTRGRPRPLAQSSWVIEAGQSVAGRKT